MVTDVKEGTLLWEPSAALQQGSAMTHYMAWLGETRGLHFDGYEDLWRWSVAHLEEFWGSLWEFFRVQASRPYRRVLADRTMPGARWFEGAELNYAEMIFRQASGDHPALLFRSERHPLTAMSWKELQRQVAAVAASLRALGVQPGDRVVAYVPNIPQSVVALLACASLGAVWSSCSPDFGTGSVVDRFRQIEPKILFAVDGYQYGGKPFDRLTVVAELQAALPTLQHTVLIRYLDNRDNRGSDNQVTASGLSHASLWDELLARPGELTFAPVPFQHPLWVLYSSGTTGLPKPIVQGHGGILLEHLKMLALHHDLKPGDRFFWFTTTGWMMWNYLVGGLLVGATILLYDGSPAYPDLDVLWSFAEETEMTLFGTSAGYLTACQKDGVEPGARHDLNKLVSVGSTGSPLPPEGFLWVYQHVKPDIWLASASGGTDLCTAFLGGCPLLPVRAGEIQCRCLGADVEAWNEDGRPVVGEVGELVITEPMPSMPLFFWNDPGDQRYRESYFETYAGVWRHGDWIKITPRGGVVIYGRSDSTLNRMGVRIGTSEIYGAVEEIPEVLDSLILGIELADGGYYMPLFVVLRPGTALTPDLTGRIRTHIRRKLTPRHVPDEIHAVPEVPRTLNGKKLEVPIKKLLRGVPVEKAANPDGMSNPESIQYFVEFARRTPALRPPNP